jgi:hypothetical protein
MYVLLVCNFHDIVFVPWTFHRCFLPSFWGFFWPSGFNQTTDDGRQLMAKDNMNFRLAELKTNS